MLLGVFNEQEKVLVGGRVCFAKFRWHFSRRHGYTAQTYQLSPPSCPRGGTPRCGAAPRPRPPPPPCRSCRRTRSSSRALAADLRRYLSSSQGRPRPHLNNEIKRSWGPVYKSSHYWWCNVAAVVPRKSEPFSDAAALLSPATRTFEVWTYLVTAMANIYTLGSMGSFYNAADRHPLHFTKIPIEVKPINSNLSEIIWWNCWFEHLFK